MKRQKQHLIKMESQKIIYKTNTQNGVLKQYNMLSRANIITVETFLKHLFFIVT